MLEQIAQLVKQYGQETVINNPDIPNAVNNDVLSEATHTITGGMKNMLSGGGLQDILSLFTGGNQGNNQNNGMGGLVRSPVVSMMIGHFIDRLINKFNMSPEKASQVSNNLIPNVLNDLVSRTKDNSPVNDSFDLNDLIGSLTGGKSSTSGTGNDFNFQDLLNQVTGNAGKGDAGQGGFDLQDIISQVTKGAQQNQAQQPGAGSLKDLISSFISN